jgi:hypothetical protein
MSDIERFAVDYPDEELDRRFISAVWHNFEVRDTEGDEPGRTARLERLVREGYLKPFNWFDVTEKGKEFAGLKGVAEND